ncbi:hypothetical protein ACWT_1030 [Actinoplanes sp. SE50]|nr:hypothetical protein ACPL_1149 [Actinoplanes sp. SE50/110]ATO80445.1 hypothetical protein ACWT_1030 [Actinoplanes sp. SE50]SLL97852.1 hypothetical protein ACSP50_1063 [Actinoplanes sp. SE50/110]
MCDLLPARSRPHARHVSKTLRSVIVTPWRARSPTRRSAAGPAASPASGLPGGFNRSDLLGVTAYRGPAAVERDDSPVQEAAASDSRNATTSATSAGRPRRIVDPAPQRRRGRPNSRPATAKSRPISRPSTVGRSRPASTIRRQGIPPSAPPSALHRWPIDRDRPTVSRRGHTGVQPADSSREPQPRDDLTRKAGTSNDRCHRKLERDRVMPSARRAEPVDAAQGGGRHPPGGSGPPRAVVLLSFIEADPQPSTPQPGARPA